MPAKKESKTRRYWLMKSEPEAFSIDDLKNAADKTTCWDGVRNYQARNSLRDDIKVGDGVLFYHSNSEPSAIVGIAEVVKSGYPDHTAFDEDDKHYDPKSNPEKPTWFMVDIKYVKTFKKPLSLDDLREVEGLEKMVLLQKGSRLSVQPVQPEEWEIVVGIAK